MLLRPPWIALLAAIALLAGLAVGGDRVDGGSRTQQLRAADHSVVLASSARARITTARRDRAPLGIQTALTTVPFTLTPPPRVAIESGLPRLSIEPGAGEALRLRARAPPAS